MPWSADYSQAVKHGLHGCRQQGLAVSKTLHKDVIVIRIIRDIKQSNIDSAILMTAYILKHFEPV